MVQHGTTSISSWKSRKSFATNHAKQLMANFACQNPHFIPHISASARVIFRFFATIVTVWYFLEGGFKGAGQTMVRSKCLTEQKKTNSSPWNGHQMKNLTRFNPINFLDTLSCCCQEKKLEKFGDWIGPVVFICSYVWWPIYQQAGFPLGYFVCLKK